MHEENCPSSWSRKDGKRREERRLDMGKREEEKGKKERTERGLKTRCVGSVSVKTFENFSPGELWWFSWCDLLAKPDDLSDRESEVWVDVSVVPDVTDVLVSPSSVVTVMGSLVVRIRNLENGSPLPQKACSYLYSCAGRGEVRKLRSESASTF